MLVSLNEIPGEVPSDPPQAAISISGLRKIYDTTVALDGVDLEVPAGSVHGLLGPNGAGKSTLVHVVSTLMKPTSGTVLVDGVDVAEEPQEVRRRIGVVGQFATVDHSLTGMENLVMIGRLSGLGWRCSKRAATLLDQFRLGDVGKKRVGAYSGGMRRRLDVAAALMASPSVLILDEPTTGLDPASRIELWDMLRDLVSDGTTVLLTTQYLEEADQLADQITLLAGGRVVGRGTPGELKDTLDSTQVVLTLDQGSDVDDAVKVLTAAGFERVREDDGTSGAAISIPVPAGEVATTSMTSAIGFLARAGIDVVDAHIHAPTLDDVFLRLTSGEL